MNEQGQWQVAGSAADVYERELVPALFAQWVPLLMDLACPDKGNRVLDLACGTGIVARIVAARVGSAGAVVGVDLNPGMLKVAAAAALRQPQDDATVEWREANADKLPFQNASFNVVYCQLGLQFFADRATVLREVHRVLVAGGRVALMVWRGIHESPGFAALAEALERHVGQAAASIVRAPFGLSDADELTALVRNAGFQEVTVQQPTGMVRFPSVEKFVSSYVAGSPLAGPLSQVDDAARAALIADVRNALGKYTSDTELSFPIGAHLLRAHV
jgi:ubiquinone/menaquinone biosynthesis C-methylase UbiE